MSMQFKLFGRLVLVAGAAGFLSAGAQVNHSDGAATIAKAEASVSPDRIREADKFISDDLFEGRYPGQRGGELAAKYIATEFALDGLKPCRR